VRHAPLIFLSERDSIEVHVEILMRIKGNPVFRRIIALIGGWLCGVIALVALAAWVPMFNEFLTWVPTEVAFVEFGKLILFAIGIRIMWKSLTAVDSFFVGLASALSWPLATVLSPLVTGALALFDVHDGTPYFIALNLTFLILQVVIVFAWVRLGKHGTAVAS
jgi:hypothetical protein